MTTKDLTVILSTGNLGRFVNPSVKSVETSIAFVADTAGVSVQWLVVADCPDAATQSYLDKHTPPEAELIVTTYGSIPEALKAAIKKAQGQYISISGGDDLLSANWLSSAYNEAAKRSARSIFYPATVIVFGERCFLYVTPDQEHCDFSTDVLISRNPWSGAMFGAREIFVDYPFQQADGEQGFGHFQWLWVCDTVAGGVVHKPVPGTFSCCHHRQGHSCVTTGEGGVASESELSFLMPRSKFFQLSK